MKLVVTEFVSLDGVMEGPGPGDPFKLAGWTVPYGNDEFMKFKEAELKAADAQLLGRITYEGFAAAWPKIGKKNEFTKKFNEMPKYVVSSTLNKLDWENSRFVKGDDLAAEIKKLKKQPGGDLLVNGSGQLINFLLDNNLVDKLVLLVYPIVLGSGKLLFKGGDMHGLKLAKSKVFKTGVVALTYEPAKAHAK